MQLMVYIALEEPITLPINYNHIVQAIIYCALGIMPDYADFLHDGGYMTGKRQYKMFQFSQLMGDYRIFERKIQFQTYLNDGTAADPSSGGKLLESRSYIWPDCLHGCADRAE